MTALPVSWKVVPLDSIADVRLGRQRSPKNHTGDQMRPYVRAANVGWRGLLLDDVKSMNFTDAEMKAYGLQTGDLLLSEASGSPAEVGKPALWRGEIAECAFQNTLLRVRPHDAAPEYLLQFFRHQAATGKFAAASRGVGIHHLGREALASWQIPLPPPEEQRSIAEVLDRADELRAKRREALAHLDALTQSIFFELFGDLSRNTKGWDLVTLASLCETDDDIKCGPFGTQLSKDEYQTTGVPLWGIKNVNSGFSLPAWEFVSPSTAARLSQYSLVPGDIVMTRKGTIGNCAVYPEAYEPGVMHSDLLRIRLSPKNATPTFLSHQLHFSSAVANQVARISAGAVMPGINVTKLKQLKVAVPPIDLQQEFIDRVSAVERIRASHGAGLAGLDALFASLQDRAFRGLL